MNLVRALLHLEGAAVLVGAAVAYFAVLEAHWALFVVLLLVPDLSMVGFIRDAKLGATLYNLGHTYLLGGALIAAGWLGGSDLLIALGLIAVAHVGMDRALGYGLKYPTHFKDTHLQRVGTPGVAEPEDPAR